jgi:hypothetical protein
MKHSRESILQTLIELPRFQRGVYPAEDFTAVKKYGLNMLGAPPLLISREVT